MLMVSSGDECEVRCPNFPKKNLTDFPCLSYRVHCIVFPFSNVRRTAMSFQKKTDLREIPKVIAILTFIIQA